MVAIEQRPKEKVAALRGSGFTTITNATAIRRLATKPHRSLDSAEPIAQIFLLSHALLCLLQVLQKIVDVPMPSYGGHRWAATEGHCRSCANNKAFLCLHHGLVPLMRHAGYGLVRVRPWGMY